jgi:hypothetical protein
MGDFARTYRAWAWLAALILGLTALAKMAGIFVGSPVLQGVEPLTGVTLSTVTGMVAVGELVLVGLLLRSGTIEVGTRLVFVFAVGALGYRLWILPPQAPCPCLGGLGYWLPGLEVIERDLLRFVLLWLAFTAWGVLVHHRLTHVP